MKCSRLTNDLMLMQTIYGQKDYASTLKTADIRDFDNIQNSKSELRLLNQQVSRLR